MRRNVVILAGGFAVVLGVGLASGDDPRPHPRTEDRVQSVLKEWARASGRVRQMRCSFKLTNEDTTFETTTTRMGDMLYRAPDWLRVNLRDARGNKAGTWLFTDKTVRYWDRPTNQSYDFPMPDDRTFLGRESVQPRVNSVDALERSLGARMRQHAFYLYAGLPARELSRWFTIRLKEDRDCYYLTLTPRDGQARVATGPMRVVLDRHTLSVRQLWTENLADSSTTIDFDGPDARPDPPLTDKEFSRGFPE